MNVSLIITIISIVCIVFGLICLRSLATFESFLSKMRLTSASNHIRIAFLMTLLIIILNFSSLTIVNYFEDRDVPKNSSISNVELPEIKYTQINDEVSDLLGLQGSVSEGVFEDAIIKWFKQTYMLKNE